MASTYSALKIELIGTGEQSGTWGATTNVNVGDAALGEAITGSADVAFSSAADVTVTLTDTNTSQTARNLRLNLTESGAGIGYVGNLVLGSGCQIEKLYLVNNGTTGAKTIKNTSGTGISVPAGKSMFVFNNGTNVVDAVTYLSSLATPSATITGGTITGITDLAVADGGTGASTLSANAVLLGNGTSALQTVAPGTNGNVLTSNGTTWTSTTPSGGFNGATINAIGSSAITLTNASTQYQVAQINSTANSIVNLPSATTLTAEGFAPYAIENRSPIGANLTIKDNAGTVVGYLTNGQIALVALLDNSTAAGEWVVNLTSDQTFFNYDTASITSNTVTPAGSDNYQYVGLSSTLFVRMWTVTTGNNSAACTLTCYQQAATISGSTITFGTIQSFTLTSKSGTGTNQCTVLIKPIRLSDTAYVLYNNYDNVNDNCGNSYDAGASTRVCTVSGTTITVGTSSAASIPALSSSLLANSAGSAGDNGCPVRLSDTSYAVVFNNAYNDSYVVPKGYSGSLSCTVITVSGTTQTVGTTVALGTSTYTAVNSLTAMSSTLILVAYGQATSAGGTTGRNKLVTISVSGTVPTWNTAVNIEAADTTGVFSSRYFYNNCGVAPSATQAVFQVGNGVAEGTVSGTVPTYDCTPVLGALSYGIYLTTSSKAYSPDGSYYNIVTGGFFYTSGASKIYPASTAVLYGNPYARSPLGAQPTTAYVGYTDATPNGQYTLLGNSL